MPPRDRNPSDPSNSCWLFADLVNVVGNLEMLPVVGPPEIMVTDIKVRVDPQTMNVACDAFPQSVIISVDITTNGPLIVTWYWARVLRVRDRGELAAAAHS